LRAALYLPNFGAFGDAKAVAEVAVEAEAAGWDGLFLWDHVARTFDTPVVDPWIALTAAAVATGRIRLGALVTPLARRRPWKLARETVSLDHLSGGRLVFGAGLGSSGGAEAEWAGFGEETDLRSRAALLDESLDVLLGLWSGEPFAYEGRHHRVSRTRFSPPPLQRPRIPVWVAGYWPNRAPFRRAARYDGVFPLFGRGHAAGQGDEPGQLAECLRFIEQERGSLEGFDVAALAATPDGDDGRAIEKAARYADAGATWWLERLTPDEYGGRFEDEWPIEAMRERVRRGPPLPRRGAR